MTEPPAHSRIFLDSGVIIQGCVSAWGAATAILVLMTFRDRYTVVLAEAVEREVQREAIRRDSRPAIEGIPRGPVRLGPAVDGWLKRVRVERWPSPSRSDVQEYAPGLLPAVRHVNDLAAVVTAVQARPDWVVSSNDQHWNGQLAERTRLRIVTPIELLSHFQLLDE